MGGSSRAAYLPTKNLVRDTCYCLRWCSVQVQNLGVSEIGGYLIGVSIRGSYYWGSIFGVPHFHPRLFPGLTVLCIQSLQVVLCMGKDSY